MLQNEMFTVLSLDNIKTDQVQENKGLIACNSSCCQRQQKNRY